MAEQSLPAIPEDSPRRRRRPAPETLPDTLRGPNLPASATGDELDGRGEHGELDIYVAGSESQEAQPQESIEEGRRFISPSEEFTHWFDIKDEVFKEFVRKSSEPGNNPEKIKEAGAYFELVNNVVIHRNPQWGVQPIHLPRLVELLRVYQFGYGQLEDFMHLEGLEELYFNRFDQGFYIVRGQKHRITASVFASTQDLVQFVQHVARENGLEINVEKPNLDASLKDGSRMNATLEPLAYDGPDFVIRKHRDIPFTIEQYIAAGMLTEELAEDLRKWTESGMNMVVSGGTGSGKAQPLDAMILTARGRGWRTMGSLKEGDEIVGSDGAPTRVTGVYPQGEKSIYRVKFSDGTATECCDDHLWAVRTEESHEYQIKSLREIRAESDNEWLFPLAQPFESPKVKRLIPPYLRGQLMITRGLGSTSNPWETLRRTQETSIPESYKWASPAQRLALLQGMCAISGSVSESGSAQYATPSMQLAEDVEFLVRSLGGQALTAPVAMGFSVDFVLPAPLVPFRTKRKAAAYQSFPERRLTRSIVSVDYVGRKPAQCIKVSAADELYITDDFVVTHNTSLLNSLGNAFIPRSDRILVLENRKELQMYTEDTKYFQTREDATREQSSRDVTMKDLIRYCLRKRPDRIIVGEVRGSEAYYALVAWNSGHDGSFCTVHADNAPSAIDKLEQLSMETGKLSELAVRKLISRAVDIVIQVERVKGAGGARRVIEVAQVFHPRKYNRRDPAVAERVRELTQDKENGMYQFAGDLWLLPLYELDGDNRLIKLNDLIPVQGKS